MLGAAGFTDVVNEANRRFDRHYKAVMASHQGDSNTTDIIPADLRIAIYSTVVRNGGEEVYEKLLSVSPFGELCLWVELESPVLICSICIKNIIT